MQMTPLEDITSWWWVRHAPVVGYDGIIYGSQDVPADTSDEEAYQSLAKGLPDDAIWVTSHLKRTHVTADAIGQAGLKQPERLIEQGLGEQNFGNWQDMTYAQQDADWRARYGAESMHKFWYCPADHRPEGGESFVDMINRVSEVINRMNETHRGRNSDNIAAPVCFVHPGYNFCHPINHIDKTLTTFGAVIRRAVPELVHGLCAITGAPVRILLGIGHILPVAKVLFPQTLFNQALRVLQSCLTDGICGNMRTF